MKIPSFLGQDMPKLPWMISYDCPTQRTCAKKTEALNPTNYLDYLSHLKLESKVGRTLLTPIICTLSAKNADPEFLESLLQEGVRSVCIDMSTGSECEQLTLINTIRGNVLKYSTTCGREYPFAIALEITGLRMRTGHLDSHDLSDIVLQENTIVYVTTNINYECHCNKKMIYINYPELLRVLNKGNIIYIDYGAMMLEVIEIGHKYKTVKCLVISGGTLRDEALIHMPNVPIQFENVIRTELITFGLKNEVDALIISRTRGAHVIECIRIILGEAGKAIMLIAKIEDATGVENIDEIIEVSDAIIISRGELGMDLLPEKLFIAQKSIIAKCNKAGKPVICGTHILKSMHKNRLPTRAEMLDAANAILDGSDGLLLSEEITNSRYFIDAIHVLQNICYEAEAAIFQKDVMANLLHASLPLNSEPPYLIALSAVDTCIKCRASCIIVVTVSGRSAKLIAHLRPKCPIIALTRYAHVARKMNFWRGILPMHYIGRPRSKWDVEIESRIQYAITYGKFAGLIKGGDALVLVSGWKEMSGFTNTVKIIYASQNKCKKGKKKKAKPKEISINIGKNG